jgi:hypothetical protein
MPRKPRPKNVSPPKAVKVSTNTKVVRMLDYLLKVDGRYGKTRGDVLERLALQRLTQLEFPFMRSLEAKRPRRANSATHANKGRGARKR